jgi:hypothetical protein
MNQPLLSLMEGLASLDAAWSGARPAFGSGCGGACHNRIHTDGRAIRIDRHGQVWFIPRPHVDLAQTPRLGGKARYGLPELTANA